MQQEIWKDIPGYDGVYSVSNLGNIRTTNRVGSKDGLMRLNVSKVGYYCVHLNKDGVEKGFYVHRLVALAFIPNPDNKEQINHKDGNKLNNNVENLEWATPKENTQHSLKVLHVKRCGGEKHPQSIKMAVYRYGKLIGISYGLHSTARMIGCSHSGVQYLKDHKNTSQKGYRIEVLCK